MRKTLLALAACSALCSPAFASVGVVLGSSQWASDGFPQLAANEQVKVFVCHGKNSEMGGAEAENCALEKCRRHYKVPASAKPSAQEIIGGHCKRDGWSEIRGAYNIAAVGAKGDNRFMFTKALGEKSLAEARKWLKSNDFPFQDALVAFNIYDTGDNGSDSAARPAKNAPATPASPVLVPKP